MQIGLVNTNRIRPPIAPIGLDYVAEAVAAAGHRVEVLDLCWSSDVRRDIAEFFSKGEFGLVGITLRNTDDCVAASGASFLPAFSEIVGLVRQNTAATVAVGGVGFSAMPEAVLRRCRADVGIWGDGEFTFARLADRIDVRRPWDDLPNLVVNKGGTWHRTPVEPGDLEKLPPMRRRWVDNVRYFQEGGQAGFETKRGCPGQCTYCADPVAKGARTRERSPESVADELECLLEQGVDHLHTCDSEFNLPERHAKEVCRELIRRGLGSRLRWYAYCTPAPFSKELAGLMREAGCAGINFGADNGNAGMLKRLGRGFGPKDVENCVAHCRDNGIATMLDLLLGSPGESDESILETLDLMKRIEPDRVGVALGIRVYPSTRLVASLGASGEVDLAEDATMPVFYTEPAVADTAASLIDKVISGDRRFFFYDPDRPDVDYNYNANEVLDKAIKDGYRGAYWDILRRVADGEQGDGGENHRGQ
jgi:radical SAM superfamily enzyme YgiQ (UPF0313 family)